MNDSLTDRERGKMSIFENPVSNKYVQIYKQMQETKRGCKVLNTTPGTATQQYITCNDLGTI